MALELDHVFICVREDAPEVERLARLGVREGRRGKHQGQGTANACFFFRNAYLELIWVSNEKETRSPLVYPTRLWERWRWRETGSCPFGICFRPVGQPHEPLPIPTWDYRPPYLPEGVAIPIAANSERSHEPLIFVSWRGRRPDTYPEDQRPPMDHRIGWREITDLRFTLPLREPPSPELRKVQELGLLDVRVGDQHCLEIRFDGCRAQRETLLAPELPLRLRW